MPQAIREAGPLKVAAGTTTKGTVPIVLITPGWGSSGYYSAKVLENAATKKVFAKGTHLFLDHPGEEESFDRPERSVRDLAATLAEDAVWDGNQLVGEAIPFGDAAEMLSDPEFRKAIGVSIRAYADSTIGEAEGRKGQIITDLVEAVSVDFVTRAGRGGRILTELMESARPTQVVERAIEHGVEEATANDTRAALQNVLTSQYGGEKRWVWVRDFDETKVWFTHETPESSGIFEDTYELDDNSVTLGGSPVEVIAQTRYVPIVTPTNEAKISAAVSDLIACGVSPNEAAEAAAQVVRLAESVPAPAGQPNNPNRPQEDTMGHIQVDEAEHGRLTEAAGRVPTLESERDTATQRADNAERELATYKAREAARPAVTKKVGESTLPPSRKARIVESVLKQVRLDENGAANVDELVGITESEVRDAETEIAELAESLGVGSVRGFGSTGEPAGTVTEADFDAAFNPSREG